MAFQFKPTGLNASETYLAKLCERSFLRLWSYPNMYAAPGKELIDLLIVCGDYVFIFSDKDCEFRMAEDISIGWKRWWKKSIHKSIYQVLSAQKHLFTYKKAIFADAKCKELFPLDIPNKEHAKIFRIMITKGCVEACKQIHGKHTGGMAITSKAQTLESLDELQPFVIGDINPGGEFIHVFDEYSLDLIFFEFDTLIDFSTYLIKREDLFRSGKIVTCAETALFHRYINNIDEFGQHSFTSKEENDIISNNVKANIVIDDTDSWSYKLDPVYLN